MTRPLPSPVLLFLLLLTAVALLPWSPEGPFDARDYSSLTGVHLEYPLWAVPLEPLLAPAHIMGGAPDTRLALVSTLLWMTAAGLAWGLLSGRGWRRLSRGLGGVAAAVGLALAWALFMSLLHLPGWRLVVDDPELMVGDLQSHTLGSHDGLVSAAANLQWHAERGYDLVAITEHMDPYGSFAPLWLEAGGPMTVIAGAEVRGEQAEYLLGLGLDPQRPVLRFKGNEQDYAARFIRDLRDGHGGATVALSWLITAEQVRRLAALGIDGIELVNSAHPDVPLAVREAMLEVAESHKVVLLASTDWHGWTGFSRTWSLVRLPGAAAMSSEERAAAVVQLLRDRQQQAFTPVVAGYIGPPETWRLVLAPLVETMRYAGELSLPRVLAWWGWALAGVVLLHRLRRRGLRAGRVALVLGLALPAAAVLPRTLELVNSGLVYSLEIGGQALVGAVLLLVAAALLSPLQWRRRMALLLGLGLPTAVVLSRTLELVNGGLVHPLEIGSQALAGSVLLMAATLLLLLEWRLRAQRQRGRPLADSGQ